MAVDFSSAVNAYREAAGAVREAGKTGDVAPTGEAGGASFAGKILVEDGLKFFGLLTWWLLVVVQGRSSLLHEAEQP